LGKAAGSEEPRTHQAELWSGEQVLLSNGWDGKAFKKFPAQNDYLRFRTAAMNLIRRASGEESDPYRELFRLATNKDSNTNSYYFLHCYGVVEAAQSDFEAGMLFDIRALIAAELLGDFIEQAEALLTAGYHIPAASLAGAVLEDTLRKLGEKAGINIPTVTKLDRLNADLAKEGVYDKLVQKRITAIADIRNSADHGHFDKFSVADVEDMVKWVRNFTADQLQ